LQSSQFNLSKNIKMAIFTVTLHARLSGRNLLVQNQSRAITQNITKGCTPARLFSVDMANPKKIVQPSDLPVRKSHLQVVAVTGGTLVFIAGMTSRSEKDATPVHPGDMRAQLRQVCENIGRALRSVGGDYSDVVKTTTFTTDVDEYYRVNDER
jgi:enamine deaminase RidA (YjgF/YER057c/UK114 family)